MPYVDHEYYAQLYGGELILSSSFPYCASAASAMLDALTMGRIKPEQITPEIKDALCSAAEKLYNRDARQGISSENNDGYSVTYGSANFEREAQSVLTLALFGTGLLYRGMGSC